MMALSQTRLTLHQPALYRIWVQGILDPSWHDSFAELTITCAVTASLCPVTMLMGKLTDQAMLLGILNQLYGLGLPLLGVEWLLDDVTLAAHMWTAGSVGQDVSLN